MPKWRENEDLGLTLIFVLGAAISFGRLPTLVLTGYCKGTMSPKHTQRTSRMEILIFHTKPRYFRPSVKDRDGTILQSSHLWLGQKLV